MEVDKVQTCLECDYALHGVNTFADIYALSQKMLTLYCDVINDVIFVKMIYCHGVFLPRNLILKSEFRYLKN